MSAYDEVNAAIPTPPPGYVIIPQAMYDLLIAQARGAAAAPVKEELSGVQLEILKPLHLGDIKKQLEAGEIVTWVPKESITIRGEKLHSLGSFLSFWNKQDPRSAKFNADFDPFFLVRNPTALERYLGPVTDSYDDSSEEEVDRILREEKHSDAAYHKVDAPGMPMRTTPQMSRKDLIRRQGPERMLAAAKRGTGLEDDEEGRSPEDFRITQTTRDHRVVVSQIPGKPADEAGEVLAELPSSKARARKTRNG